MARVNKTQYAILGCILIKPMSAYEIKTFMAKSTNYFWSEREGQLYPTLKLLEKKGWVTYNEIPAAKSGSKKIYQPTQAGREVFDLWFESEIDSPVYRHELLLKLFFGRYQPEGAVLKQLESKLESIYEEQQMMQQVLEGVKQLKAQENIDTQYYEITIEYAHRIHQAEVAWCQWAIKSVKKRMGE